MRLKSSLWLPCFHSQWSPEKAVPAAYCPLRHLRLEETVNRLLRLRSFDAFVGEGGGRLAPSI